MNSPKPWAALNLAKAVEGLGLCLPDTATHRVPCLSPESERWLPSVILFPLPATNLPRLPSTDKSNPQSPQLGIPGPLPSESRYFLIGFLHSIPTASFPFPKHSSKFGLDLCMPNFSQEYTTYLLMFV